MIQITVEPLRKAHIAPLFAELSKHALWETYNCGVFTPKDLERALARHDEAYVGKINDTVVCAYGIIRGSLACSVATIWMLATEHVEQHPFVFIRHSQRLLERLSQEVLTIACYVSVKVERHQRWMRLLGFEQFGVYGNAAQQYVGYRRK